MKYKVYVESTDTGLRDTDYEEVEMGDEDTVLHFFVEATFAHLLESFKQRFTSDGDLFRKIKEVEVIDKEALFKMKPGDKASVEIEDSKYVIECA